MRWLWLVVLAGLTFYAQVAWLPLVRPLGVVPNLALGLVVLVALEGRALGALVVALALGCGLDIISGGNFGIWMGTLVLAVLVAAWIRRSGLETGGWLVPAVLVLAGTVVMTLLVWSALVGVVARWPVGSLVGRLVLECLLNLGLMSLLRPVVRRTIKPEPGDLYG
ncbi:MAG TPA: hypothetical protein VI322_05610 [Candidatus Saccharimonadia bacterium]